MAKAVKKTAKKAATKKVTKKNVTNLIIIDASGSMASKASEVKGGLKQIFSDIREDMKKDKNKVNMRNIVIDFSNSTDIRTLIDSSNMDDLTDSVADNYRTRGLTALLDAIGKGMSMIDKKSDIVFINILTDGEENDSKEFTSKDISDLIKDAKDKNWAVTFMGTTEASISKAQSLGVTRGNTMSFADNAAGVKMSMDKSLSARKVYYAASMSTGGLNKVTLDNLLKEDDDKLDNTTKKK